MVSRIARILSTGYFTTTPVAAPAPQPVRPRRLLTQRGAPSCPRDIPFSPVARVSALVCWALQPDFMRLSSHVDRPTGLVALVRLPAVFAGVSSSWSPNRISTLESHSWHVTLGCVAYFQGQSAAHSVPSIPARTARSTVSARPSSTSPSPRSRLQEGEAVAGGSESSEYRNLAVSGAEAVLEAPPPQSSAFAPHQVRAINGDDVT